LAHSVASLRSIAHKGRATIWVSSAGHLPREGRPAAPYSGVIPAGHDRLHDSARQPRLRVPIPPTAGRSARPPIAVIAVTGSWGVPGYAEQLRHGRPGQRGWRRVRQGASPGGPEVSETRQQRRRPTRLHQPLPVFGGRPDREYRRSHSRSGRASDVTRHRCYLAGSLVIGFLGVSPGCLYPRCHRDRGHRRHLPFRARPRSSHLTAPRALQLRDQARST
jgi:hypothetical protein